MLTSPQCQWPYPPVAVAIALAERSHALPGSPPTACARLSFVVELGEASGWSDATRAAHALREVCWEAIADHLGEPVEPLKWLDPAVLLTRLGRRAERAEPGAAVPVVSARSA